MVPHARATERQIQGLMNQQTKCLYRCKPNHQIKQRTQIKYVSLSFLKGKVKHLRQNNASIYIRCILALTLSYLT